MLEGYGCVYLSKQMSQYDLNDETHERVSIVVSFYRFVFCCRGVLVYRFQSLYNAINEYI